LESIKHGNIHVKPCSGVFGEVCRIVLVQESTWWLDKVNGSDKTQLRLKSLPGACSPPQSDQIFRCLFRGREDDNSIYAELEWILAEVVLKQDRLRANLKTFPLGLFQHPLIFARKRAHTVCSNKKN